MKRVLHIGSTYTFALLFIAAGIFHVIEPSGFARMMPGWPFPYVMVYATACFEWSLAVSAAFAKCQDYSGKIHCCLSCTHFPCKLICRREGIPFPGQEITEQALLWIRLIGQPILIVWVMSIAKWEKS